MILEGAIPKPHLDLLREQSQVAMDRIDAQMDDEGTDKLGVWHGDTEDALNFKNHRGSRYFIDNCFKQQTDLRQFLFSELMAELCRATLGDNAYLFWEQYVIKGSQKGKRFQWESLSHAHF